MSDSVEVRLARIELEIDRLQREPFNGSYGAGVLAGLRQARELAACPDDDRKAISRIRGEMIEAPWRMFFKKLQAEEKRSKRTRRALNADGMGEA